MSYKLLSRIISSLLLVVMITSLSGCYIKKRQMDYLYSQEVPPLHVPPNASCVNVGSEYPIPPVMGPAPTHPVCIVPPGSTCAQP